MCHKGALIVNASVVCDLVLDSGLPCFRDFSPIEGTTCREGVCHRIRVLLDENHVYTVTVI